MQHTGSGFIIGSRRASYENRRAMGSFVTAPAWLIAEREFRTYVATASFWLALAIGPIGAGVGLFLTVSSVGAHAVNISFGNMQLDQSAAAALEEAGRLEGLRYRIGPAGPRLFISLASQNVITARFDADFPLSASGRALFARTLERDAARRASGAGPLVVRESVTQGRSRDLDLEAASRFALMLILWLTLVGSLGMLLQAVVRERVNRSLESLLAAARPWEIVLGKLAGVGGISLLILFAWLGSVATLALLLPSGLHVSSALFTIFATPIALLRAVAIYILAYAFYGSLTLTVGALSRDTATAQNFSRPMFVLLLVIFFVALASVSNGNSSTFSWLVYVPPFTPFLLLLAPPASMPAVFQVLTLGSLLITSLLVAAFAASRLSFAERAS